MGNSLTAFAPTIFSRLQSRRRANEQSQSLRRELAAFNTPSARLELDEITARHSADDARLVQELLRQAGARHLLRHGR